MSLLIRFARFAGNPYSGMKVITLKDTIHVLMHLHMLAHLFMTKRLLIYFILMWPFLVRPTCTTQAAAQVRVCVLRARVRVCCGALLLERQLLQRRIVPALKRQLLRSAVRCSLTRCGSLKGKRRKLRPLGQKQRQERPLVGHHLRHPGPLVGHHLRDPRG